MPSAPSAPSTQLSLLRVAWRHLASEWVSAVGVALSLLMALLPAGLILVDRSGARSDLRAVVAAAGGVTIQRSGVGDAHAFDAFQRQVQGQAAPRLGQYMDNGSARAVAAPFRLASIGTRQPSGTAATGDLAVNYVADLPARVDVVQGLFPKPGTAGEQMATMPLAVADRIGVQLFDVVCIGTPAPTSPTACMRIVGLWRPAAGADRAWTAPTAQLRLFTERDDFFALARQQPAQNVQASRQYAPRPGAITPQNAGAAAKRVSDLKAAFGAGQVVSALDAALAHYAATSVTSFPVELLSAALVPLLTLLAVVAARWYVEPRLHELALLRARGWSGRRVRRLVLAELALLGAPAFVVAVAGLLAVAWQASDGAIGAHAMALSAGEVLGIAVAAAVLAVAAIRFVGLANWASRQSVLHLDDPAARPSRSSTGPDASTFLLLPAALLLLLPRLAGSQAWHLPGALDDLGGLLLLVAGLVLLVVAALPVLSLATPAIGSGRGTLEGTMAQANLRRWWQQHAAAGVIVVLAFALASYAAVALVDQILDGPGGALGQGIAASLAIGFASAVASALLALGVVFLVTCRSRVDYYAALLVDGLPAGKVKRGVAIEQRSVLLVGLVGGLVIGLVLVLATASAVGFGGQAGMLATGPQPASLLAGLAGTAAIGVVAGLAVAATVRQKVVAFRLVEEGWRET